MDIVEKEATAVMITDPGTGGSSKWKWNGKISYGINSLSSFVCSLIESL